MRWQWRGTPRYGGGRGKDAGGKGKGKGHNVEGKGEGNGHRDETPFRAVECIFPGIRRMPPQRAQYHTHHYSTLYNIDPAIGPFFPS